MTHKIICNIAHNIFKQTYNKYQNSFTQLSNQTLIHLIIAKTTRVKTLLQKNQTTGLTNEHIHHNLYAIINYSILSIILQQNNNKWTTQNITQKHQQTLNQITKLYTKKTTDYNQQWKTIPPIAHIEIILMKLHRILSLTKSNQQTNTTHELTDIINYSIFTIALT